MHLTFSPLASVHTTRNKFVAPLAIHFVTQKLTLVCRACSSLIFSLAVLATLKEIAFISGSIRIRFDTITRLVIGTPFTFVRGSVRMGVFAVAMHETLVPLAIISRTIGRGE